MQLHNQYIPSMTLHDELGHQRIWIGMPTLTTLSYQRWSNVVPMWHASKVAKAAMPTKVQCSTNVGITILEYCPSNIGNLVPHRS